MVGRNAQLGIAALVELARGGGRRSASEIAKCSGLTAPSVAKVLSSLRQAGFIDSIPGPGGGFILSKPASEITILSICEYFESETAMPDACAIVCGCSEDSPCKVCDALKKVDLLRERTLADLTIDNIATL